MNYENLSSLVKSGQKALAKGPIALILAEDAVELKSTLEHHLKLGFCSVILFGGADVELPEELAEQVHFVRHDMRESGAAAHVVNRVAAACPGLWIYYCYNTEYLFYPFCESRTIGELLAFNTEERRDTVLTYVVDIYARNLNDHPEAVSLETACLDRSGYYALGRKRKDGEFEERQLDFYGGLRWRFEEHIPKARRRIDRVSIFKAIPGIELRPDYTFNLPEYNTYSCPWHHNVTAAVCSFRAAKALRRNPGSRSDIDTFHWHNSVHFDWTSQQLLDLGLIEPGQWF
ncbi:glycosyltransferase family 2 protein [Aestuariibius insulae]|uniref:glycosyltransferase family 2 protein n=1 Tax=Aestuariibius insulae TaxID=2058287 RepID=UPI00345EC2E0